MTGRTRQDDVRRAGDEFDRLIDDAVESAVHASPVDLRMQVLGRLDEPTLSAAPGRSWMALLPAAGAVLVVVSVGLVWRHADRQIGGMEPLRTAAATTPGPGARPSMPAAISPPARAAAPEQPTTTAEPDTPGRAGSGAAPARETRVVAASWLAMDAASRPGPVGGASFTTAADDEAGARLPGAPMGNLGDPIVPMPRPRLILIPSLATPPIPDTPTVSTLGTPVGELTIDDVSRGPSDPGKPGGK
jgi:hypothetical protein